MGVDKNSTHLYGNRQVWEASIWEQTRIVHFYMGADKYMGDKQIGADMYIGDKYMEADKNSTVLYGSRQTSVRPGDGVPHRASTLLRHAPCLINF